MLGCAKVTPVSRSTHTATLQQGGPSGKSDWNADGVVDRENPAHDRWLAAAMNHAVDGKIIIDGHGTIEVFSRPAERIFGYRSDEVLGRNVSLLMPSPYRDQHDTYIANYQRTGDAKIIGKGREVTGRRKDGSLFPMDLAVGEMPEVNGIRRFVGTVRDISDRRAMEEKLQQTLRFEAMGKLTGGVAHEFNNLLAVVMGSLESLLESQLSDAEAAHVWKAKSAVTRGSVLNRHLLAFARRQPLKPVLSDVNDVVERWAKEAGPIAGSQIALTCQTHAEVPSCLVDGVQLATVLTNLVLNCQDAMPEGGQIAVETRNVPRIAIPELSGLGNPDDQFVSISMSDDGTGMAAEVAAHAFEPFFTTKDVANAAGLGLSMAFGFAKQSGGHIEIKSEVGRGTIATIYLPAKVTNSTYQD